MASVRSFTQRHALLVFFVLAFAGLWVWLPLASISPALPPALGTFSPAIAALLTAALVDGQAGVRQLLKRLTVWRVGAAGYLAALGPPTLVGLGALVVARLAGGPAAVSVAPLSAAAVLVFLFAAGEELGWRGFALPRLLAAHRPLWAGLIVGAVHAVWHWPLILLPGQLLTGVPLLGHTVVTVAAGVLYAWLLRHTRGSALVATLFHGAMNATSVFYIGLGSERGTWYQAAVYLLLAGLVVWLTGPDLIRPAAVNRAASSQAP